MSATQIRPTYQSSDVSRSPGTVFDEAADHPIVVTRRDGDPLILMSEKEDSARTALLELAGQLIGAATSLKGTLAERMNSQFPWMLALGDRDRDDAAQEILDAARASFATSQPHLALSTLVAWRETATAVAAGFGAAQVSWLDEQDDRIVERP